MEAPEVNEKAIEFQMANSAKLFSGERVKEFPKEKILFKDKYLAEREVEN